MSSVSCLLCVYVIANSFTLIAVIKYFPCPQGFMININGYSTVSEAMLTLAVRIEVYTAEGVTWVHFPVTNMKKV